MLVVGPEFESAVDHIRDEFYSKSFEWDNKDFVGHRVETKNCSDGC